MTNQPGMGHTTALIECRDKLRNARLAGDELVARFNGFLIAEHAAVLVPSTLAAVADTGERLCADAVALARSLGISVESDALLV